MAAVLLLPLLSATAQDDPTLEASFRAFARCASDESARTRLDERLSFFASSGLRSEEEVKKLPDHVRKNEQEQVLALQDTLVPAGVRVSLAHLTRADLNGCEGTVIVCLRDGSFRCAVELTSCPTSTAPLSSVRVLVQSLRPAADCGYAVRALSTDELDECERAADLREEVPVPLTEEAIGRVMAQSVQMYNDVVSRGELPTDAADLGSSAYPDLPYAALVIVMVRLRATACAALRSDDMSGAARAIQFARELEEHARPSASEVFEIPRGVRAGLAALVRVAVARREPSRLGRVFTASAAGA